MEEDIFELLDPIITERLSVVYNQDESYKQAMGKEAELYEQLKQKLTEEQGQLLDEYFAAVGATFAICEKITYRQAMKDLASFIISLIV